MKSFIHNNLGEFIAIVVAVILLVVISVYLVDAIQEVKEYGEWYKSLSPEEQACEREKYTQRYEVVSVDMYTESITNGFGSVVGSRVCYTFQYMDNGKLITVDEFENLEYGLTKVIIGDSNMYIVDTFDIDTYRYLQLTEEALQNCKLLNN